MAITLDDVVLEQMQTNETLGILVEKTNVMIELQESGFDGFIKQLKELYLFMVNDAFTQNRLARERHRELMDSRDQTPIIQGGDSGDDTTPPVEDSSNLLKAGIFSVTALAVKEFVAGFGQAVRRDFARLRARGGFLGKDILKPIKDFNSAVKDLYKRRGTGQFNLKTLKTLGAENTKRLQSFFEGIKKIEDSLRGFFRALKPQFLFDIVDDIKSAGSRMSGFFKNSKAIRAISSIFSGLGMTRFMGAVGGFFNTVGRIFYPIYVAYEVIVGMVKEVTSAQENASMFEKIMLGLVGAGKGIFRAVFGIFDFVKDIVSFISEKLGFLDFAKYLDSFSFAESVIDAVFGTAEAFGEWLGFALYDAVQWFKDTTQAIGKWLGGAIFDMVQWFGSIPEQIGDLWGSLPSLSDIGNSLSEATKSLVRAILPPADFATFEVPKLETWFGTVGGGSINFNPIPDALYEWANSPAPKREPIAPPPSSPPFESPLADISEYQEPAQRAGTARTFNPETGRMESPPTQLDGNMENLSAPPVGSYSTVITRADGTKEVITGRLEVPQVDPQDRFTNDLFDDSQFQTAAPITNIIDSSVNTSNQQNVSAVSGSRPMSSPTNNNRTRASAYAD